MRQAIKTSIYPPTNCKGARVKAQSEAGHLWLGYDHSLNVGGNHAAAARALCIKLGWTGYTSVGALDGDFYWIYTNDDI